jgi:hypothetical protein
VTFTSNLVALKLATESYGYGLNGKQFAMGTAVVAVLVNVALVTLAGWVDLARIRREWRKVFVPAGFRTTGIVMCGLLVLCFQSLNALTANALYKGILIPIALFVAVKMVRKIQCDKERKAAVAKLLAWPQLVAVALAVVAVVLAVVGSIMSGGFNLFANWFPPTVISVYAWCYFGRLEIMRSQDGEHKTYTGGEQPFAALGVLAGVVVIHLVGYLTRRYLPELITPNSVSSIVQQMLFTKAMLEPRYLKLMVVAGLSFGLYASASVLILMYKDGQVGTVTYGTITHKWVGLVATILSAFILDKLVPVLTGKVAKPVSTQEWIAFTLFAAATFLPPLVEIYRALKRSPRKKLRPTYGAVGQAV